MIDHIIKKHVTLRAAPAIKAVEQDPLLREVQTMKEVPSNVNAPPLPSRDPGLHP